MFLKKFKYNVPLPVFVTNPTILVEVEIIFVRKINHRKNDEF